MSWLDLVTIMLDAARTVTGLAANWLIQSTLLIAGGIAVGHCLRGRGSAVQSAVYRTTLVAALACPLATCALSLLGVSGWSLRMPTAYTFENVAIKNASEANSVVAETPLADTPGGPLDSAQLIDESSLAVGPPAEFLLGPTPVAPVGEQVHNFTPAEAVAQPPAPAAEAAISPPAPVFSVHNFGFLAAAVGVLWLAISILLLARLLLSWRQLARLRHGARPAEPATIETCRAISKLLDVLPPDVLHSPYLPSPCLTGVRRPAVLLPESDVSLPMRDVLVHELAHLVRHDCFWNVLRRVATAALFLQPLLWVLSRRLAATAEEVCDDYVVQFGGDRREYAHRLVDIAELSLAPVAAAGVGIVSFRSMLAARVARIMDTSRSLSTRVGSLLLALVLLIGLTATLFVGLLGVEPNRATADATPAEMERDEAKVADEQELTIEEESANIDQEDLITIRGQVVDQNGKAVAGAKVRLPDDASAEGQSVTTRADGRFQIEFDKSKFIKPEWHQEPWRRARLIATADHFGPTWISGDKLAADTTPTLVLRHDDVQIRGQVLTLEGKPVSHATLEIWAIYEPHTGNLDGLLETVRDEPDSVQSYMNREMEYLSSDSLELRTQRGTLSRSEDGNALITADDEGRFECRGIGKERLVHAWLQGSDIQSTQIKLVTRNEIGKQATSSSLTDEQRMMLDSGAALPQVYGATFQHLAGPSRPIKGVVRDKESGKPIAGIRVAGWLRNTDNHARAITDENGRYELTGLALDGTFQQLYAGPKEEDLEKLLYLGAEKSKLSFTASATLTSDQTGFELSRGILVRGRVLDASTHEPVKARVEYFAAGDNPQINEMRDELWPYASAMTNDNGEFTIAVLPGSGALAVWTRLTSELPDRYRPADAKDFGLPISEEGFLTPANRGLVSPHDYKAARYIDFEPGESPPSITLSVQPVTDVARIRCVDPNGSPLNGVSVVGHLPWSGDYPVIPHGGLEKGQGDERYIEIAELGAESRKPVIFRHSERKLAAVLFPSRSEREPRLADLKRVEDGVHLLTLTPSAAITGQLVDKDRNPVSGADVELHLVGESNPRKTAIEVADVSTDRNGRFALRNLPAGGPYLLAAGSAPVGGGIVKDDFELTAGETIDVGAIDISKAKRPEPTHKNVPAVATKSTNDTLKTADRATAAKPSRDADNDVIEYAGQVVTPDGKPAIGAQIFLVYHVPQPTEPLAPAWRPMAATDSNGKFRFTVKPGDLPGDKLEWSAASIVAVADSHGFAWSMGSLFETSGDFLAEYRKRIANAPAQYRPLLDKVNEQVGQPLRLVADSEPIRGQVIDINGQPVSGARLILLEVWAGNDDDLTPWLDAAKEKKADYYSARTKTPRLINGPQVRSLATPAVTDADGRFTLRGVGRERIAEILIQGPGIETSKIFARTRAGEKIELDQERDAPHLGKYVYHPAEVVHIAGPSKPIVGRVRDGKSRKPLAGVTIKSQKRHGHAIHGWGQDFIRTVTDADGRYRLEGMPIGNDNRIAAIAPADQAYLPLNRSVDTGATGDKVELNFDLPPAVWIEGRVSDKQTGKGLSGQIEYFVYTDNPHLQRVYPLGHVDLRDRYRTDDDGRFRIPALPGGGVITFLASDGDKYPRAAGAASLRAAERPDGMELIQETHPYRLIPINFHVLAEVNPAEDAERLDVNLELDAGGNIRGKVTDLDGRPLIGARYAGQLSQYPVWDFMDGDSFEVVGYKPDQPRRLLFHHAERRLAGSFILQGPPPDDFTVKLQAAGSVTGRLVDADGEPMAKMKLVAWTPPMASPADTMRSADGIQPAAVALPPNVAHKSSGMHETDDQGRFSIAGLAPGIEYRLLAFNREAQTAAETLRPRISGPLEKVIVVEAGQSLDLGDVQLGDEKTFAAKVSNNPASANSGRSTKEATPQPGAASSQKPTSDAPHQIRGRVVGPDGKPIHAATLIATRSRWLGPQWRAGEHEQLDETQSDPKGRFELRIPSEPTDANTSTTRFAHQQWQAPDIIATAPGHALAWVRSNDGSYDREIRLQLPPNEGAIQGRILNSEGQPLSGVRVAAKMLWQAKENSVDQWLKDLNVLRAEGILPLPGDKIKYAYYDNEKTRKAYFPIDHSLLQDHPNLPSAAITDEDGRFEIPELGADRLAVLEISGAGVVKHLISVVTRKMPPVDARQLSYPAFRSNVYYGREFDHVAEPGQIVLGRVVDAESNEPLVGVTITSSSGAGFPTNIEGLHLTTSGDDGRFRIEGMPIGEGNELKLIPSDGQSFLMTEGIEVPAGNGLEPVTVEVKLRRGIFVRGRVADADTGEPVEATIHYHPFLSNEFAAKYSRFDPNVMHADYEEDRFRTKPDGSFQIVVVPGRGVLAAQTLDTAHYCLGIGAEEIAGLDEHDHFPTYDFCSPRKYHRLKEINVTEGAELVEQDLLVVRGGTALLEFTDPDGQPVAGVRVANRAPRRGYFERPLEASRVEITGLHVNETRQVALQHEQRKLGAIVQVKASRRPRTVRLEPSGLIKGRLINDAGEPLAGLQLNAGLLPGGDYGTSLEGWHTNEQGWFAIELPPGGSYRLGVYSEKYGWPTLAKKLAVQARDSIDLGTIDITSDERPEPKRKTLDATAVQDGASKQNAGSEAHQTAKEIAAQRPQPVRESENATRNKITGRVTGPDGKPLAGARVGLIGGTHRVARGGDLDSYHDDVIHQTTTDADGRFAIQLNGVSSKSHRDVKLIASAEGMGVAWQQVNPDAKSVEASFGLSREEVIRGRLVDIEARPAAGVTMSVRAVMVNAKDEKVADGAGYRKFEDVPAAWPQPVTTDDQGQFAIHNVAAGHGVSLYVEASDRFAPQNLTLNTGQPEERSKRDGTYRPQVVKNLKPGEAAVVALSPAQIFEGVVRYEDTGQPAPHARLTIWASQQDFGGSMISVAGKADSDGRYHIVPFPGIRFGVTAYPPDGVPYLVRQVQPIKWEDASTRKQVDVKLPRGVLVSGKVVESKSGAPVAGATIQYVPQVANNTRDADDILTGWQGIQLSNEDGEFEIVVLPGPGRLLVHGPGGDFVLLESSSRELSHGTVGGQRTYAHAFKRIDPTPRAEPLNVTIEIERGDKIAGRVVDPDGHPVEEAIIITQLQIDPLMLSWRGYGDDALQVHDGWFELTGVMPGRDYEVYFLDAKRRLGAAATLKADGNEATVQLKPCGQVKARFVDADGQPLVAYRPWIKMIVSSVERWIDVKAMGIGKFAPVSDFIGNIDRTNYWPGPATDNDGVIIFPALIPGAKYQLPRPGSSPVDRNFTVEPLETLDLGEFVIEEQD